MARVIREAVSDAILNHLSDPRIQGVISVTRVDMPPDLKSADVYLSIMIGEEKKENLAFKAIEHATSHLKALVAKQVTSKFAPKLRFHRDTTYKKTLETMQLIEEVSHEWKDKQEQNDERQ